MYVVSHASTVQPASVEGLHTPTGNPPDRRGTGSPAAVLTTAPGGRARERPDATGRRNSPAPAWRSTTQQPVGPPTAPAAQHARAPTAGWRCLSRRRYRVAGVHARTSPTCASTPRSRADSTISGELSHASTDGVGPALRQGEGQVAGPATEVDHPARLLGTNPRQQVEERTAAVIGEGQVDVGIPHDDSVPSTRTHSGSTVAAQPGGQQRPAR